ncbi:XRE family transcriptional regulator [Thomasclavelia cocleata]|uniref:Helix-turn-helix n=1 Tax=Thomasclavelia cocleata TaxID=69824 RepID=A0A1I0GIY9_9FIRM|nr:helix-turn-helix transcriptional regulator [Thomasclavelia cocleata]MCR1961961.1 helix-turn-helix domain-containing protein [Thomasclavelia cocleata]NDO43227.1 helix-turn-helix transcriptional regulator [Thomasclavelia cocleata]PJN81819.1 XRE family transcriptional regulator [Thomasclavelia cocleata]SET70897.1 Helix-turn-helix [Thomasclavelia cocleata]
MDKIEIRFGQRVKEIRLKQNISQEELAFRCGLSKNYISDVERGTRNISLKSIEKIAEGFVINIKDLFEFK